MSYTPGPLPKPYAHHAFWPEWDQWHDSADPLPVEWDDEQPTDVVHVFTASQMQTYTAAEVARAVAAERERWQDINAMAERLEQTAAKLADENESLRAELKRTIADALMAMTVEKASERERCAMLCESLWEIGGTQTAKEFAKEIRSDPQRLQGKGEQA